jgi:hypothetical protein
MWPVVASWGSCSVRCARINDPPFAVLANKSRICLSTNRLCDPLIWTVYESLARQGRCSV